MKFLFDLSNEEQLPILYDLTELAVDYMAKTQIIDRWKNLPTLKADATKEDIHEATKRNLLEMMKVICKEYPKETAKICDKMWVLEKTYSLTRDKEIENKTYYGFNDEKEEYFVIKKPQIEFINTYYELVDEKCPNVLMTLFRAISNQDAISFFQSAVSLM